MPRPHSTLQGHVRRRSLSCQIVLLISAGLPAQAPGWLQARVPESGAQAAAYDSARGRFVVVGARIWEWDGRLWLQPAPTRSPGTRFGAAVAYDAARRRVLLFGGWASGALAETWEWNGADWTKRAPSTTPSARWGHAMAYDAARQRVVMFGGRGDQGVLADTWEWDGTDWAPRAPSTQPSGRWAHAMAYDSSRRRTVLFGGVGAASSDSETWTWDGSAWTKQSIAGGAPAPRGGCAMAYDAGRRRLLVHGGWDQGGNPMTDTWEMDGSAWSRRSPAHEPTASHAQVMAFDAARGRPVMFNGSLWEWSGTDWSARAGLASPGARKDTACAYDTGHGCIVMFGGDGLGDTWTWRRGTWVQRFPATSPGARSRHALAYDPLRQRVVLFGGRRDSKAVGDTWEWDGNTWTQRTPQSSPSPRSDHAMVYDSVRRRILLFGGDLGGVFGPPTLSAETWEWDGSTWTRLNPRTSPGQRTAAALAHDPVRQRTLLFGGGGPGGNLPRPLADTWEWDGRDWNLLSPRQSPDPCMGAAMAYDPVRQRLILCSTSRGNQPALKSWEWSGADWLSLSVGRGPGPRSGHGLAYDAAGGQMVLVAGSHGSEPRPGDTWLLRALDEARVETFGRPCAGSAGPALLTSGVPSLGHPGFRLELLDARPNSPCVFAFAAAPDSQPLGGGCSLYVKQWLVALTAVSNPAGFAEHAAVPIPADVRLRGLTLFAQGFVADPRGPVLGLAFSAGRRLVVGD